MENLKKVNNRFLNMAYFIEVIEGRLNGSSEQVESNKRTGFDNVSYVKKIGGRGLVSAPCQKFNIKRFMVNNSLQLSSKMKIDKKIVIPAMPHKNVDEDIFGFMRADKDEITEEKYNELDELEKSTFRKNKNKYERNITKKRKSRFAMSPLINIDNRRIELEWNVASTSGDAMPYSVETYSGIFAGISNVDINNISNFTISGNEAEFRDYSDLELGSNVIKEEDLKLSSDEKYKRIEAAMRGLEYLSIQGNQNNHLTDTSPKFIILTEYSWGNNVFQGVIKKDGVDVEALMETMEENEEFRLSDAWIGISKRIDNENYKNLKAELEQTFEGFNHIHIGTVKSAFDGYLKYLKESL